MTPPGRAFPASRRAWLLQAGAGLGWALAPGSGRGAGPAPATPATPATPAVPAIATAAATFGGRGSKSGEEGHYGLVRGWPCADERGDIGSSPPLDASVATRAQVRRLAQMQHERDAQGLRILLARGMERRGDQRRDELP